MGNHCEILCRASLCSGLLRFQIGKNPGNPRQTSYPLISGAYDDYRELEDISREARYDFSELRLDHLKLADDCLAAVKSVGNLHL
jgi:hypothetical protein